MKSLRVDANFPGGGVDNVHIFDDTTICFEAPLDLSPRSLWYYFRITGARGRTLKLIQRGLEQVLGVFESRGYSPVVPVWKDAGQWKRVNEDDCLYSQDPLQFSFSIKPKTDECYVAFCFPYMLEDASGFFNLLPHDLVSSKMIGFTKAKRPHLAWIVGYPDHPEVKKLVVLTARQHAGEVSGSFALEGFLRELTEKSDIMTSLLQTTLFLVVPILDLDSVEEGCYGKDQLPIDFNRDWSYHPYHREIRNVMNEIESLSARFEPIWACDFHSPQPGGASYMPPSRAWAQDSAEWNRMWNLALLFEEKCQKELSFHLHDVDTEVLNWGGKMDPSLIGAYFQARWGCLSGCFEFSYHRDSDLHVIGVEEWNKMGRLLAQATAEILLEPEKADERIDISRIPPWTIAPPLTHWKTTRKIIGIDLVEDEESIILEPNQDLNNAWVTTPEFSVSKDGGPVLSLSSAAPCQVEIYVSFFKNGLHVKHSNKEYILISENYLYYLPPIPENGCQYTISVIVKNLIAPLKLEGLKTNDV